MSFNEVFKIIDIQKLISKIETPLPFAPISKALNEERSQLKGRKLTLEECCSTKKLFTQNQAIILLNIYTQLLKGNEQWAFIKVLEAQCRPDENGYIFATLELYTCHHYLTIFKEDTIQFKLTDIGRRDLELKLNYIQDFLEAEGLINEFL